MKIFSRLVAYIGRYRIRRFVTRNVMQDIPQNVITERGVS